MKFQKKLFDSTTTLQLLDKLLSMLQELQFVFLGYLKSNLPR
jgi:hypothetical protein